MVDIPYENTLTTNGTFQQLTKPPEPFSDVTVTSPSRIEEKDSGFDIKFEGAKQLVYQYKRAVDHEVSGREIRTGKELDCFRFPFNGEQARTLLSHNPVPGVAFYVFPLVESKKQLSDILTHTVFVDVHGIFGAAERVGISLDDIKSVYIDKNAIENVYLKDKDAWWETPAAYLPVNFCFVKKWREFATRVSTCYEGLRMRKNGNDELHPEFRSKQSLDRLLNEFTDSDESKPSVEAIEGVVDDLFAQFEQREERWDSQFNIIWDESNEVAVKQEIGKILSEASEAGDLIPEGAMSVMAESGGKAQKTLNTAVI